jgi:predicted kinase
MTKEQHYLFLMLGSPGSGKSFVAEWLQREIPPTVHIRSDDLRLSMFGEDRLELHTNPEFKQPVYGAMDYMARQILSADVSVIYDANMNRRDTRHKLAKLALERGAVPLVIWLDVPIELAEQRVIERAERGGHEYFDISFVRRLTKNIEPPTSEEHVIRLDGRKSAEEQQQVFHAALATIKA